jgi:ubiquinone/menaquinone biosynthesis C-methylase UbiE
LDTGTLVIFRSDKGRFLMSSSSQPHPDYVIGHSEQEQQRLLSQAGVNRGWTERFFLAAGLGPGMRVLDVGCGMGDVSLLVAEFVGPSGKVIGIDRNVATLNQARERTVQQGCSTFVSFVEADANTFHSEEPFNAVVGRYVLLYQADPVATLRQLSRMVSSGGLLVFHECDFGSPVAMWPEPPPLWQRTMQLLAEVFRRAGTPPDFGLRLTRTFLDAGLPWPSILAELPVGGETDSYLYGWVAEAVRSVLPSLEKFNLASTEEIQIDTLASRLETEVISQRIQLIGPTQFGAWIRKP